MIGSIGRRVVAQGALAVCSVLVLALLQEASCAAADPPATGVSQPAGISMLTQPNVPVPTATGLADAPIPPGSGFGSMRAIDFCSALQTAGSQNPQIGLASQRIAEAYAALRTASVLWLPAIRAGLSYNRHEGPLQATDGTISNVSRSAMETGLGAGAVGAGSPPIPGVSVNFRTTDALFQPRIAEYIAGARQQSARATTHDLLLSTALAYLDLLRAYQLHAIARETLEHAQQLADLTATFARAGQGAQADADRARAELVMRQNEFERASEATEVASVRLSELLSMDPTQLLAPSEPTIVPMVLVARECSMKDLVMTGLRNRPELGESQQLVGEAVNRMQREQMAPLLPSLALGASYSGFGGAPGADIDRMAGRVDFDMAVYWEVRGLGVGESAVRQEAAARVQQAQFRQVQVMDRIAREVAEGYAQVQARLKQIGVAQTGIQAATDSFQRNYQRIREGQGLPIEVLQAIQALDQARREYLRTVADYDESQFRLYRAIGYALSGEQTPFAPPAGR